ncbi:MAG TPA: sensor histidine kinase N-terminal domain-containing protein [Steroidobacteraceae bacterium]|nr:sensor histidine kinase N-terminal domain-containing protein [Steroidobacteraceae bacterium]
MSNSSLRVGLVARLGVVLVVVLSLDALACYFTALYFANLVYDRWLVDSTRSLAQIVRAEGGRIEFDPPRAALQVFQFDEVDRTYFKVSSASRGFLAGEAQLPDEPVPPVGGTRLSYATLNGTRLRLVSTRVAPATTHDTVQVSVAESLIKRNTLTGDILVAMVAPQVALLALALPLAWFGVARGLKPLTDLAAQIESRDQNNLAPVPQVGLPLEAHVLVARINELLARLQNAMWAQKRFVADAAHQLRTPLAGVLLQVERAQRATDKAGQTAAFRALHLSIERAARLVGQLLALARTDPEAASSIEFKATDLTSLAREVGEEWVPRALEKDVDFGLVVPEQRVVVKADGRLLREMLSNLIDNALRYGRPAGRATVIVEGGTHPALSVQDDGPGIPESERTRIFERFYRLPEAQGEGCGLGLSIVEEIARIHGCSIAVTAGSDQRGSRFTVTF